MKTERRLALLIDGDNAEATLLSQILAAAHKHGVVTIRRIYGDWSTPKLKSWKKEMQGYALKPEQQFNDMPGRNATDIALVVDAMDILHTAELEGFCIVSGDSDYAPLVTHLREKNKFVVGIGNSTTSRALRKACNVFETVGNQQTLENRGTKTKRAVPKKPAVSVDKVQSKVTSPALRDLFQRAYNAIEHDEDGWAHLGAIGKSLRKIDKNFKWSTYDCTRPSQFINANPDFIERKGKDADRANYVRLKSR